jgi:hypothetical protein
LLVRAVLCILVFQTRARDAAARAIEVRVADQVFSAVAGQTTPLSLGEGQATLTPVGCLTLAGLQASLRATVWWLPWTGGYGT